MESWRNGAILLRTEGSSGIRNKKTDFRKIRIIIQLPGDSGNRLCPDLGMNLDMIGVVCQESKGRKLKRDREAFVDVDC